MGTPAFAVESLKALIESGYPPIAVVTIPDKKKGRGQSLTPSAVKVVAEEYEIPVLQPDSLKEPSFAEQLKTVEPDVIVVVAFRILPESVYSIAKKGAFNLHASLLPAFRGAAPINHAVMEGAAETGVTTFFLKPKVDTGDMILQRSIEVGPNETAGRVHDRLACLGAEAVVDTVRLIEEGKVDSMPQDESLASPAPKVFKKDMKVDWTRSAGEVHNHIRGLSPYPTAWTTLAGETIKLYKSRVVDGSFSDARPGTILSAQDRLIVACGIGAVELHELQKQGKKRMTTENFLNGTPLSIGDRFESS